MGKIIAVANQKGGVGKTTTAVNLSACVAGEGRKTLLCDMDPQGNATSGLGAKLKTGESSVYECLIEELPAQEAVIETAFPDLSVLPASINLAGAEVELVAAISREYSLKRTLAPVKDTYDYIFVDCPPSLGLLTLNALTAADSVFIPIQCEYYALEGVTQLVKTVQTVKKRLNPALEIEGVALTMLDGRTNLGGQVVDSVKRYFMGGVYATIIPRNVRLSEAPSHGVPIHLYDKASAGAEAYRKLALEFLKRAEGAKA